MTTRNEILQQVQTSLADTGHPPTLKEKEILNTILYHISAGNAEYGGTR